MIKSKIFFKTIILIISFIFLYNLAISSIILPKVNTKITSLEEQNGKTILSKTVMIVQNVHQDLENYKKLAIQRHKDELKNLTDTSWSIIETKYNQSKPENISSILKQHGEIFKKNLTKYYNKNKKTKTKEELIKDIKSYINIHRYDNNSGYFFVGDLNHNVILHPVAPHLIGKNLGKLKSIDGKYFVKEMTDLCKKNGYGTVTYKWQNPITKQIEDKVSYGFIFKPLNWIIVNGAYYSSLKNKLQDDVIELINKLRYSNNNYFYISDYNNVLISHPYLQGKDFTNIRDKKGNLIVPPMVNIAKEKGEGFYSYWWKKNSKDNTPYEKLTFSKNFPDWEMVIGTGVYIDDIEKKIEKRKKELLNQLRKIVNNTKISKTGYLFIFNSEGKMLIHPNSNIDGKSIKTLKNPAKGTFIFDDLVKAANNKKDNSLYYKWDKPSDKGNYIYDKVSWITYIPEMDWYIASSAYVDEFKESSKHIRNYTIVFSSVIVILSLIIISLYLRKLLLPISRLTELTNEVSNGNYKVRSDVKTDDEIGQLSKNFNIMIDTIKDNIENLDIRIKEKTQELFDERKFIQSVMNSQSNIVVTCKDKTLQTGNKAFLEFFDISEVEQFKDKYGDCICETFDKNSPDEYIQQYMPNGDFWIDYILKEKEMTHKVIIKIDNLSYIFTLTAEKFVFKNQILNTITFTDVTELENTKKEAEMILKSILLPVLITSKETRKIIYANKYAEIQYETSLDKLIGSNIDDIYSIKGQQTHIIEALKKDGFVHNFEEIFFTKSGNSFTALLSVIPITYHNQASYIGMVTDISKQKEIEEEIRKINKHTKESIEYASLIQGALIPDDRIFNKYFSDFMNLWKPKDIVGGDIYLVEDLRDNNECLIMVIDCTGHGVPGAFVTMLVKAIERQIIAIINNNSFIDVSPAWILSYFNKTIKTLLKQEDQSAISNAGFDGGIIYYNKKEKIVKFSGAETPLFYTNKDGKLNMIKGDRHSVGYKKSDADYVYTEHTIEVEAGMQLYLTTDGYLDQNGGQKGFPFGKKQFGTIITKNYNKPLKDQKEVFIKELDKYQGNEDRNDDISMVAVKL